MLAVQGYYDGTIIQPLEKIQARPNQRVIITIMDDFISPTQIDQKREKLEGFFSLAEKIDIDEQAIKELREGSMI